eukprot:TRINITY_DN19471_c0_g1_i2.p1 TRINITY_DN19471_c0_g1~~TRINITY_DN19471_c0_g1_i2.p1  ORF type:complete len:311 (+),score=80.30 TRINITY_DN19471_c0_g1_i2:72-1004(+)
MPLRCVFISDSAPPPKYGLQPFLEGMRRPEDSHDSLAGAEEDMVEGSLRRPVEAAMLCVGLSSQGRLQEAATRTLGEAGDLPNTVVSGDPKPRQSEQQGAGLPHDSDCPITAAAAPPADGLQPAPESAVHPGFRTAAEAFAVTGAVLQDPYSEAPAHSQGSIVRSQPERSSSRAAAAVQQPQSQPHHSSQRPPVHEQLARLFSQDTPEQDTETLYLTPRSSGRGLEIEGSGSVEAKRRRTARSLPGPWDVLERAAGLDTREATLGPMKGGRSTWGLRRGAARRQVHLDPLTLGMRGEQQREVPVRQPLSC